MRHLLLCAALLMVGAPTLPGCIIETSCTTLYAYGVSATVRDTRTGAPVSNATLVLVDGAYRETMTSFGTPGSYAGAGEREGTYTLTVTAQGYQPSSPRTIVVTGDECHVNGQSVTIDLTPL